MPSLVVAVVCAALAVGLHRRERRGLGPGLLLAGSLVAAVVSVLAWARGVAGWSPEVSSLVLMVCPGLVAFQVAILLTAGAMLVHPHGRRVVNLVALVLGLVVTGATTIIILALGHPVSDPWRSVCVVALLWLGYLGFIQLAQLLGWAVYARTTRARPVDVIIVLGAGLIASQVTRLLASRLDRALDLAASPLWNPGGSASLIVSGGQGPDESVTEAAAMAGYLTTRGLPAERVLLEDQATTTMENVALSSALMSAHRLGPRVALVTNDFHVLRTGMTSLRLGLDATVVGSWTASYYLPRAVLRELAAIVATNAWTHAVVVGLLAVAGPLLVRLGV